MTSTHARQRSCPAGRVVSEYALYVAYDLMTPDKVETRIGTLDFTDGRPSDASLEREDVCTPDGYSAAHPPRMRRACPSLGDVVASREVQHSRNPGERTGCQLNLMRGMSSRGASSVTVTIAGAGGRSWLWGTCGGIMKAFGREIA